MSGVFQGKRMGRLLVIGTLMVGLSAVSDAQTAPTSGLGQAWPNASDVSASPNWHVYVFVLNGIKYIQINDRAGTVHAAIGTAGGSTIVLPIGVDSQRVSTNAAPSSSPTTVTVYSDSATAVTATTQSNGNTTFNSTDCNAYTCTGGRGQ